LPISRLLVVEKIVETNSSGWYHIWFGPVAFALTNDADYAKAILTAREGIAKQTVNAATPPSMRPWGMANLVFVLRFICSHPTDRQMGNNGNAKGPFLILPSEQMPTRFGNFSLVLSL
jgi:hypothetical protein